MKKKFRILPLLIAVLMIGAFVAACRPSRPPEEPPEPDREIEFDRDDSFTHFPRTQLIEGDNFDRENAPTIYVINNGGTDLTDDDGVLHTALSSRDLFVAGVIQGLFARDTVKFYISGTGTHHQHYFDFHSDKWGLNFVNISLEHMIQMYIDNWYTFSRRTDAETGLPMWGSNIMPTDFSFNLPGIELNAFTPLFQMVNYMMPGYILYREGTRQANIAATLAGITGFLPVAIQNQAQRELMTKLGLQAMLNIDNINFDYDWLLDTVEGELNNTALIHQRHTENEIVDPHLRDIGTTFRFLTVFYDAGFPERDKLRIGNFIEPNSPIYGYMFMEGRDVERFSRTGQFFVPTDFAQNLTFFAAREFSNDPFTGRLLEFGNPASQTEKIVAEDGYHYVAFVVSDGDNVGQWQITYPFARNFMGAPGRTNDTFPVTWGVSPSIVDMMPSAYWSILNNIASPFDSFVAPVTGQGYANLVSLLYNNPEAFDEYLSAMEVYLRKSGLSIVTAMSDPGYGVPVNTARRKRTRRYLSQVPSLRGGIMFEGGHYFRDVDGVVYWATGQDAEGNTVQKPFVGPRDSLWNTNPAFVAARLNYFAEQAANGVERYLTNSIDAFSLINVHPWSHSYQDMRRIVEMSSDNVRFVSTEQLFDMIIENVDRPDPNLPDDDVSAIDNTVNNWPARGTVTRPLQSGHTLGNSWLADNYRLIPANPHFHEFLFHTEGWTGIGGELTHSVNNGPARQEGFTRLHRSINIPVGVTAVQPDFRLPDEDNLFVWFMARGNAHAANAVQAQDRAGRMKFEFTVNGITRTIIPEAFLRAGSDSGYTSATPPAVVGDGWQYFGFPLRQYFDDYKGQIASAAITALNAASGLQMTFFTVETIDPPAGSFNVLNNQFLNHSTEDWTLGHMWVTTQFTSFGASWIERGGIPFPEGSVRLDVSNGGGPEMRGNNSAMFIFKHYTLPAGTTGFTFNVDGGDNPGWGAMYKISLYIDGQLVIIQDWVRAPGNFEFENPAWQITWDLAAAGITVTENTDVTVMLQARDSGDRPANGAGEKMFFRHWVTNV